MKLMHKSDNPIHEQHNAPDGVAQGVWENLKPLDSSYGGHNHAACAANATSEVQTAPLNVKLPRRFFL